MPYPFSQGIFLIGSPLPVPSDASADELERLRGELEATLNRMTIEADAAARLARP